MGEVIEIHGDQSVIRVYEDTSGIRPGEPVLNTKRPFLWRWAPVCSPRYDGIQRLEALEDSGLLHHPWCRRRCSTWKTWTSVHGLRR